MTAPPPGAKGFLDLCNRSVVMEMGRIFTYGTGIVGSGRFTMEKGSVSPYTGADPTRPHDK